MGKTWSEMFNELRQAERDFKAALANFNWAESSYIDKANSELTLALNNYNSVRAEHCLVSIEL